MNVLFDLDGTLSNPRRGLTRCLAYALERLQLPVPEQEVLERYIGPPLRDCFTSLLGTDERASVERAISLFRERFSEVGIYETELYAGADQTLDQLTQGGHRLFLATSQPEVYARRALRNLGIDRYFTAAHGDTLSGDRSDKSHLIAHILKAERLAPVSTVMIGDRDRDALGARANGVRSIGVLWGYGTADELDSADRVANSWDALLECIAEFSR